MSRPRRLLRRLAESTEHLPWIEEPARRLAALDGDLRGGRFATAAAAARAELERGLGGSGGRAGAPALDLAESLSRLALAEAGLGRVEDALWHWHEAENLAPGVLSKDELGGFGAPGALLAAHPLRRPGEAPAGIAIHAGAGAEPPRRLAGELPAPAVLRQGQAGIPPSLRIEIAVDAAGEVREPVVVSGRAAEAAVRALESLRGFRFAPATAGGAPVAVLAELTVDPPAGRPLAGMLPAGGAAGVDLGAVEALLRAGRFAEAGRLAARRWDEALHGAERSPDLLGAALALRALAEAGTAVGNTAGTAAGNTAGKATGAPSRPAGAAAVCRWQAAQVLSPALYDASLAPYGAAGGLLDPNRWGSERWVIHGGADRRRAAQGGVAAAAPPLRPRVVERARPVYPRFLKPRRLLDAVVVSGVVDAQGALRQPEVRSPGASPNLDAAALDALCGFRFQPAVVGGAPVASFYSVTLEFSPN